MWAIVKDNKIKELLRRPKALTLNGIQHPKDIFRLWSKEDLKKIGIYAVDTVEGSYGSEKFYDNNESFTFDAEKDIVKHVKTSNPKSDVDGIKTRMLNDIKATAASLLSPFDWYIIRQYETKDKKVTPYNIATYRADVRSASAANEVMVNDAVTIADLEAVSLSWPNIEDYPSDMAPAPEPAPEPEPDPAPSP